jgi:DNA-binding transcriptional regulator YiaG
MEKNEIKTLRAALGLTQEAFAQRLGVAYLTVVRWEGGKFKPSRLAMEKINLIKNELEKKNVSGN